MLWRVRLTRAFLWVSVVAWGVGVGAKLYDLTVLAGAWSAAPPKSLTLLPYGPRFPVDSGAFFLPTSVSTLVAAFGALTAGWKTPLGYRIRISHMVVAVCAAHSSHLGLYRRRVLAEQCCIVAAASGSVSGAKGHAELLRMTRQWVVHDWWRVAMMAAGFVSSVRAISVPFPQARRQEST